MARHAFESVALLAAFAALALSSPARADFIFATDLTESQHQIYQVDSATGALVQTINVAHGQDSLLFDDHNRIIYSAFSVNGQGQVRRVNADGTNDTLIATVGNRAVDLAYEPDKNHVLVTSQITGQITRVDLVNGTATPVGPTGTYRNGITYDSTGRLFALRSNSQLVQLDPSTKRILASSRTIGGSLDGMTFDPSTGNIFIGSRVRYAASGREGLYEIDLHPGPNFLHDTLITSPSFSSTFDPDGMEADGQGRLYIASQRNAGDQEIYVYDIASGRLTALSSQVFPGLDDLAPLAGLGAPVPEPSTIGLVFVGALTLIGYLRHSCSH